MDRVSIVIPAYQPDNRLIELLNSLEQNKMGSVYLVDDGSGELYQNLFAEAKAIIHRIGGKVLTHEVNCGKGRALKTAFQYIIENDTDTIAVVTADSDGQHTCECIRKVIDAIHSNEECLILGVRDFDRQDIPWKSKLGNKTTEKLFKYIAGIHVTDTQTGLRGIPRAYMKDLIELKGERFEFEMRMLLDASGKLEIKEVPIKTIYASVEHHQTHFKPIRDSLKIYRILGERFIRYIFSSVSSCILDLLIFGICCMLFKSITPMVYVAIATVIARCISAIYNYCMNYKLVFKSKEKIGRSLIKYFSLAALQMLCSALFVTLLVFIFPNINEVLLKTIVDVFLFFISYYIQQQFVFKKSKKKK